jgi:hypothetical protein
MNPVRVRDEVWGRGSLMLGECETELCLGELSFLASFLLLNWSCSENGVRQTTQQGMSLLEDSLTL